MDQAECDDVLSDDDDDEDSMNDDIDIEGLIDNNEEVQENDPSFYRAVDIQQNNLLPVATPPHIESATPTSVNSQEIERQQAAQLKRYKKDKAILNKLMTHTKQCVVLGFNSQKYDIPLIQNYLASSLIRLDSIPKIYYQKGECLHVYFFSKT